jgi:hypothetical protein
MQRSIALLCAETTASRLFTHDLGQIQRNRSTRIPGTASLRVARSGRLDARLNLPMNHARRWKDKPC